MSSSLNAGATEYVPSWSRKPAPGPAPGANVSPMSVAGTSTATAAATANGTGKPSLSKNGFTTSITSTNVVTTHRSAVVEERAPYPSDKHVKSPMVAPSPTALLRVPTRMSPIFASVPTITSTMSANAKEFIPCMGNAASLPPLPTSTADLAEKMKQEQSLMTGGKALKGEHAGAPEQDATPKPALSPVVSGTAWTSNSCLVISKSDEEIAAIGRQSSLKVTAEAYIPRRTLKRISLSKASPAVLKPASGELILGDLWCLFYLPMGGGENVKESTYDPTLVFRIDSIASFWRVFNNLPNPTEMDTGTLYFFHDNINPKWEDARNHDGGIVKIKLCSRVINEAWIRLLCCCAGEAWSGPVQDVVNGIALKVRGCAYILEVWVTKQTPELMADISQLLHPVVDDAFSTLYIPHLLMKQRATTLAEKGKTNRHSLPCR
uniref:Putative eukaryotic translation initiation factor 4e n=1 Tax=Trypanosoma vivax (strain Y486) TaxID=1055687 RepID=G0TWK3_TRYVY|nr:putative eukaryotic translation initiation factor 4e [Trypanosoma vivax Y486]